MRPLSAVPIRTVPGCNPAAIANAVTVGELQTTSVAPSGRMRKTALRADETSVLLLVGVLCGIGAPLSSIAVMVTEVVGVPSPVGCGVAAAGAAVAGRAPEAASLSARA